MRTLYIYMIAALMLLAAGCTGDALVDPESDTFTPPPLETISGKVVLQGYYPYLDELDAPQMGLMWIKDQPFFDILDRDTGAVKNAVMGVAMDVGFPLAFDITIPQLPGADMLVQWTRTETTSVETIPQPGGFDLFNPTISAYPVGKLGMAGIFIFNDENGDNAYDLDRFRREGYFLPGTSDWMAGFCPDYCIIYVASDNVLADITAKNRVCAAYEEPLFGAAYTGMYGLATGYNLVRVTFQRLVISKTHPFPLMAGWRFERVPDATEIRVQLSDQPVGFEYDWLIMRDRNE